MEVIWRGISPGYEEARCSTVWNLRRPDRYPVAIIKPKNESEIQTSVQIARHLGKPVALRSGGHSYAVWSLRTGSILIDLGNYHGIEVDAEKFEARVSPSTKSNMDSYLNENYGLVFGAGHSGNVGLGGYLLQGGLGLNFRNWGWGCERVNAIDVVTADGSLVHCNSEQNNDLFWAARGAGPGFPGIVTKFYLQLRPAPQTIRMTTYKFPAELTAKVCEWILKILPSLHDTVDINTGGFYLKEESNEKIFLVILVAFSDTIEEAFEALSQPHQVRPDGALEEFFFVPSSLEEQQEEVKSSRFFADNVFLRDDANLPSLLQEAVMGIFDEGASVGWVPTRRPTLPPLPDMALSLQSSHYISVTFAYEDEKDDELNTFWVEQTIQKLAPFSVGTFTGETDFQYRHSKYWGPSQTKRLEEIRKKWDPEGRFCGYLGLETSPRQSGSCKDNVKSEFAIIDIDEDDLQKSGTSYRHDTERRSKPESIKTKIFVSALVAIALFIQFRLFFMTK